MPWSHATQFGLKLVVEDNLGPLTPLQFSRLRLQMYPQSTFHPKDGGLIYEILWKWGQNSTINRISAQYFLTSL